MEMDVDSHNYMRCQSIPSPCANFTIPESKLSPNLSMNMETTTTKNDQYKTVYLQVFNNRIIL